MYLTLSQLLANCLDDWMVCFDVTLSYQVNIIFLTRLRKNGLRHQECFASFSLKYSALKIISFFKLTFTACCFLMSLNNIFKKEATCNRFAVSVSIMIVNCQEGWKELEIHQYGHSCIYILIFILVICF